MWKSIWESVREMLGSKKAMVALVSALVWILGKVGLALETEALVGAVAPLWVYIWAQGRADTGKEAAKLVGRGDA